MNDKPYWETEQPQVVEAGKQRFKYYKDVGTIEICTIIKDGDSEKEIRYQTLSAHKLLRCPALCDMVLDLLSVAGLVSKVD